MQLDMDKYNKYFINTSTRVLLFCKYIMTKTLQI